MSEAIENLQAAMQQAGAGRPKVGGFPYLAETLRRSGVARNVWSLPACQSLFLTEKGPVVMQGQPLVSGPGSYPNRRAIEAALRAAGVTMPVVCETPAYVTVCALVSAGLVRPAEDGRLEVRPPVRRFASELLDAEEEDGAHAAITDALIALAEPFE